MRGGGNAVSQLIVRRGCAKAKLVTRFPAQQSMTSLLARRGDEEDMDRGDLGPLLQTQVDRMNTFSSVSYCYGKICGVKIAKQKRGAKTVSHALLYVRWDPRLFPVEDNDSLEWVNVIPRNYGAVDKDSWELVEVRTRDDGPAAVLSSESDGDSEMEAETELPSWEEDSEGEDERESEGERDVSEDDDSDGSDFG